MASGEPFSTSHRMGPITKYMQGKEYLDSHKIPQMFQSLISSLMLEKPENPVQFLDTKLEAIKEMGVENVDWETFITAFHPERDPIRNEYIKKDDTNEEKKKGQDPFADEPITHSQELSQSNENYKPELFNLTEPQDEDDTEIS